MAFDPALGLPRRYPRGLVLESAAWRLAARVDAPVDDLFDVGNTPAVSQSPRQT